MSKSECVCQSGWMCPGCADQLRAEVYELRQALSWALEFIDAIPCDCTSKVDMPGFDRDYVEKLISGGD